MSPNSEHPLSNVGVKVSVVLVCLSQKRIFFQATRFDKRLRTVSCIRVSAEIVLNRLRYTLRMVTKLTR